MTRVIARRRGRIAFGAVLIAGAIDLVVSVASGHGHALEIIGLTWLAALAAGFLAVVMAKQGPERDRHAVASLVVPIVGIALLGPITVHALCALLKGASGSEFDNWVAFSAVFTGPAHLAFAALAAVRARQLATGRPPVSPCRVYWITVGVSCVPFALLVLPPILVALTGTPFLLILGAMEPLAVREREVLRGASDELAFAIARCR